MHKLFFGLVAGLLAAAILYAGVHWLSPSILGVRPEVGWRSLVLVAALGFAMLSGFDLDTRLGLSVAGLVMAILMQYLSFEVMSAFGWLLFIAGLSAFAVGSVSEKKTAAV